VSAKTQIALGKPGTETKSRVSWQTRRTYFRNGAVGSSDWLDVGSPPVNKSSNDETADPTKHEDRNILVSNNSIRQADE
jgi:hypothetical protein